MADEKTVEVVGLIEGAGYTYGSGDDRATGLIAQGETATIPESEYERLSKHGAVAKASSSEGKAAAAAAPPPGATPEPQAGATPVPADSSDTSVIQSAQTADTTVGPGSTKTELLALSAPALKDMAKAAGIKVTSRSTKAKLADALSKAGPTSAPGEVETAQDVPGSDRH